MVAGHLIQGQAGEDAAVQLLETLGFQILERNWRCRAGEVDVVCLDRDTVVFVEVRTRADVARTSPTESVTRSKVTKLARAASFYLSQRDWWKRPCRFDVVAVVRTKQGYRLEHIPDAFSFPQALGRGRNPWQPW
ncbi:MAG: YraN family protein [Desulfovibrionales bacterium]|nr:MAG: YraN family protein [Desulfovibrionales bacterium]